MKYVLWLIVLGMFNPLWSQKKTTVALLDLEIGEGVAAGSGAVLSNLIRTEFVKSDQYDILDRGNMDAILKEQDFVLSDACSGKECAVQVGQLLGVEKMIFGSVGSLGKKLLINLQMVDVSSGRIEKIEGDAHVGAIEDLDAVIVRIARKLIGEKVMEAEEATYSLYVTSDPEGATIYVEDEMRGTTPTTLLFSGGRKVRLYVRADAYQEWFQEVQPKKGEKVIVNAKLLPIKSNGAGVSSGSEEYKLRNELYEMKRKSGVTAFTTSVFTGMFGGGHFYARSYARGGLICLSTLGGFALLPSAIRDGDKPTTSLVLIYGGYFFDLIGSQFAVRSYNNKLKKELKLSLTPLPVRGGGGLQLAVQF